MLEATLLSLAAATGLGLALVVILSAAIAICAPSAARRAAARAVLTQLLHLLAPKRALAAQPRRRTRR
ncbi:hypothetical protein N8J89_18020 [Crossiella sp. CA-258035]|uniref:hypothetical protein n=1 Tax=Crossiella sp. CA-258035 TaxID=2981138 RepID=UPI0024BD2976|nr:hypothetical protein [Crossiella sp. CA-258035]WHT22890.1 hypothetical protein N8J89_18020 [Crossiella sp. CA-258035]